MILYFFSTHNQLQAISDPTKKQGSELAYIFSITPEEARKLYESNLQALDDSYFHSMIKSTKVSNVSLVKLPKGYYLITWINKEKQIVTVNTVADFKPFILNNDRDLRIQVLDLGGKEIQHAKVQANKTTIPYDVKTRCYFHKKSNLHGVLCVEVDGFTGYYTLNRSKNNPGIKRMSRNILYGTPVKFVWKPVRFILYLPVDGIKSIKNNQPVGTIRRVNNSILNWKNRLACAFNSNVCSKVYNGPYKGYVVFDKDRYRKQDTVRLKTFILDKKQRPLQDSVYLFIRAQNKDIKLFAMHLYRPGAYQSEFFLHDSLKLHHDISYKLTIRNKWGHTLQTANLKLEDYQLKKYELEFSKLSSKHYAEEDYSFKFRLLDANGIHVFGSKASIQLKWDLVSNYFEDSVFVKDDVFWDTTFNLNPVSWTQVAFPQTAFAPVKGTYSIQLKVTSPDNEVHSETKLVKYNPNRNELEIIDDIDSLQFRNLVNGLSHESTGKIYGSLDLNSFNLIYEGPIPVKLPIQAAVYQYRFECGEQSKVFYLDRVNHLLNITAKRKQQQLHINSINPRKILFHYQFFRGNKIITSGITTNLDTVLPVKYRKDYSLSLQYTWAGHSRKMNFNSLNRKGSLDIEVKEPSVIFPGQEQEIEVHVKNHKGNPVSDVDLTAFGMTSLFNHKPQRVPVIKKKHQLREVVNNFTLSPQNTLPIHLPLDFYRWRGIFGLDSLLYYHIAFPDNGIFRLEMESEDNLTTLKPYAVDNKGNILQTHVLYIDHRPVYLSWNQTNFPYIFKIEEGIRHVKIRTSEYEITLDSVFIRQGMTHLLSLNAEDPPENIEVKQMPDTLIYHERRLLSNSMLLIGKLPQKKGLYLEHKGHIHPLFQMNRNYPNQKPFIIGPVSGNFSIFQVDTLLFDLDRKHGFRYDFLPPYVYLHPEKAEDYLPEKLANNSGIIDFNTKPISPVNFRPSITQIPATFDSRINWIYNLSLKMDGKANASLFLEFDKVNKSNASWTLLRSIDHPNFIQIRPSLSLKFKNIPGGTYVADVVIPDKSLIIQDTFKVLPGGTNFYRSKKKFIEDELKSQQIYYQVDSIAQIFEDIKNEKHSHNTSDLTDHEDKVVSGRILDAETYEPIIFASIYTNFGILLGETDIEGNFHIKIPANVPHIQISYIGYKEYYTTIPESGFYQILMDQGHLNFNISIIEYSIPLVKQNQNIQYTISGSATGYSDDSPVLSDLFSITGNITELTRQINSYRDQGAIIIVNGKIFPGDPQSLPLESLSAFDFLPTGPAMEKYGEKAGFGAVVLTIPGMFADVIDGIPLFSEEFMQKALDSDKLRMDFRDNAFWQPGLTTDKDGKATFKVKFPDDITQWSTYYLAMNRGRQSGEYHSTIKSFKPIIGHLNLPRFLIMGDSSIIQGRAINYTGDSISYTGTFKIQDSSIFESSQKTLHHASDFTSLNAVGDSLEVKYEIFTSEGFYEGERRVVQVLPEGLNRREGGSFFIHQDTAISISVDPANGPVHFTLQGSVEDFVMNTTELLTSYPHFCNEQMASKLTGYLYQRKLLKKEGEIWEHDSTIHQLIDMLLKNRITKNHWGWWPGSSYSSWVSHHVIRVLILAVQEGFNVPFQFDHVREYLLSSMDQTTELDAYLSSLRLLDKLGYHQPIKEFPARLKNSRIYSKRQKFQYEYLQFRLNADHQPDSLLSLFEASYSGGLFLKSSKFNTRILLHHQYQLNIDAYWLIKSLGPQYQKYLDGVKRYFIETFQKDKWINTYYQSQILEILMDDFRHGEKVPGSMQFIINSDTLSDLTLSWTDSLNHDFEIEFKRRQFAFFTYHQEFWETLPFERDEYFKIYTALPDTLMAGKEFIMKVSLELLKHGEFMMVNIPIPGSCSFVGKPPLLPRSHTEYNFNQVNLYIEEAQPGVYHIDVPLIPRFSGEYTLNPVQVSLMYFPEMNGNNTSRRITIR